MTRKTIAKITSDEVQDIMLIINKRSTSAQALQLRLIPEDLREDLKVAFYKAAQTNFAEASFLEKLWWGEMKKKYGFSGDEIVRVDIELEELYVVH